MFHAGPPPQAPDRSVHRRTSTPQAQDQSVPRLTCTASSGSKYCQNRACQNVCQNMAEKNQIECQRKCQCRCQKECQIRCQNRCQIKCQKRISEDYAIYSSRLCVRNYDKRSKVICVLFRGCRIFRYIYIKYLAEA